MSSDMATANAEFKVVQKRSSNQGKSLEITLLLLFNVFSLSLSWV